MELIKEIGLEEFKNDMSFGRVKRAVRGIVFNDKQEIAIIESTNEGWHGTPGGGIDDGENFEEALKREALEEVGYEIEILKEIGLTIEYRVTTSFLRFNFYYVAKISGGNGERNLTDYEKSRGFELKWMSLSKAIETIESEKHSRACSKIANEGDTTALKKVKKMLDNGEIIFN